MTPKRLDSPKKLSGPHTEAVPRRCGHTTRLCELHDSPCGKCRNAARSLQRAEREAAKVEAFAFRFPAETVIQKKFNGTEWEGVLQVSVNGVPELFEHEHSNSFKLEIELAEMFRVWVKNHRGPEVADRPRSGDGRFI